MITLIAHFVIFSSKKINRLKTIFVFFFLFWAAFCTVLTAQNRALRGSASRLHSSVRSPLTSERASHAPPIPSAVEKRTSVYAFQRRVSALPKHRYCMEPAASVPLFSRCRPWHLLNVSLRTANSLLVNTPDIPVSSECTSIYMLIVEFTYTRKTFRQPAEKNSARVCTTSSASSCV